MDESAPAVATEIDRYLRTGEADPCHAAWPGGFLGRAERASADLRGALVQEVRRLSKTGTRVPRIPEGDTAALTRRKAEPMVRGLFPRAEQDTVLAALEQSVVFLTPETIEPLLLSHAYDGSAWDLANLYLASLGAELLGENALCLAGISENMTCFVSAEYFDQEDPYADFVVHETAHIFHNCKRGTVGLKQTRMRERLLNIEYRKRETFAYACEAYSRILERATSTAERHLLAQEYGRNVRLPDERVDPAELAEIVQEAAAARNGWKVILARCAPKRSG